MPESPSPSLRALVLDDDQQLRGIAAQALRNDGFEVREFADADAALAAMAADRSSFDVMITDVMMPGMTGPIMARHLDWFAPDMPVVFMSGFDAHHLRVAFGAMSPTRFLRKPFQPRELTSAVLRAILNSERAVP
jgi:two-component system cell cycle sensor histidine kinase/response regulator CckA